MTERDLGYSFNWFIAEVVNVYDPDQSGRVQIRVFGRHDDKNNIPDSDLPWAMPLQPVTSAAYGKVGTAPLGLLKGSKVTGFWADLDHQYPILLGSFGKAGDLVSSETADGVPKIDIDKGSIPNGSTNLSDPRPDNAFSTLYDGLDKVTVLQINDGTGDASKLRRISGIDNRTAVDSKLKEPKKQTTASADKTDTSNPLEIVKKVDPNAESASLPNAVDKLTEVKDKILATSPIAAISNFGKSLTGAIGSLGDALGLGNVSSALLGAASSGELGADLSKALAVGLAASYVLANKNGGNPVPHQTPPTVPTSPNDTKPPANLIVPKPPTQYIQQYYSSQSADPYPTYITWKGPGGDFVYTSRGSEPYHTSAASHVQTDTTTALIASLAPSLAGGGGGLTGLALGGILSGNFDLMKANSLTKVLGVGVGIGTMAALADKLLPGGIGGALKKFNENKDQSSLNQSVSDTTNKFTQAQAVLASKKDSLKTAAEVPVPPIKDLTPYIPPGITGGASDLVSAVQSSPAVSALQQIQAGK